MPSPRRYHRRPFRPRMEPSLERGNYSSLAGEYAAHRAGYAPVIAAELLDLAGASAGKTVHELDVADVGAGTGIWTRMLAQRGSRVIAVEPDDAMRARGSADRANASIVWRRGSAEQTGLPARSCDLVT